MHILRDFLLGLAYFVWMALVHTVGLVVIPILMLGEMAREDWAHWKKRHD